MLIYGFMESLSVRDEPGKAYWNRLSLKRNIESRQQSLRAVLLSPSYRKVWFKDPCEFPRQHRKWGSQNSTKVGFLTLSGCSVHTWWLVILLVPTPLPFSSWLQLHLLIPYLKLFVPWSLIRLWQAVLGRQPTRYPVNRPLHAHTQPMLCTKTLFPLGGGNC